MVVDDSVVIRGLIGRWIEAEPDMVVVASLRTGLDAVNQVKAFFSRLYDGLMGVRPFARLAPYSEGNGDWHGYSEVVQAFGGHTASAEQLAHLIASAQLAGGVAHVVPSCLRVRGGLWMWVIGPAPPR